MPQSASRKKVTDGPPNGGSSPWLLAGLVGLAVVILSLVTRPSIQVPRRQSPPTTAPKASASVEYREPIFEDPQANAFAMLVRDLARETDQNQRDAIVSAWLAQIKTDEISRSLTFLQGALPADLAQDLSKRLLRRWADAAPEQASAWLATLPSDQQSAMVDDVAVPWANNNATNAITWAKSMSDDTARRQALAAVAGEVVRSQPLLALDMILDLPAGAERDSLIRRGVMEWASADATGAIDWVKQIPAGDLRNQAVSGVAIVWSANEPVAAANFALNELSPGRVLDDTVVSIVQRWAQKDSAAAAAWVDQFPAGPLRDTAVENLAQASKPE